jgi:hypothetical protein
MTCKTIIDLRGLGFSDAEIETAGRVAVAVRNAALKVHATRSSPIRSQLARVAVTDTLLRAGGWRSQRDNTVAFQEWLREVKRCTIPQADEKRLELSRRGTPTETVGKPTSRYTRTATRIRELESQGLVRYIRGDAQYPGEVFWIGE